MKKLIFVATALLGLAVVSCGPSQTQIRAEQVEALKKDHDLIIIPKSDVIDSGGKYLTNAAGIIIKMKQDTIHVPAIRVVTGWSEHLGVYMPKDHD